MEELIDREVPSISAHSKDGALEGLATECAESGVVVDFDEVELQVLVQHEVEAQDFEAMVAAVGV